MGLCHDVNGRVASLLAVVQLVEYGEPIPSNFSAELERLEDVAGRMAQLVGDVEASSAPLGAKELLDRAAHLYGQLKDRPEPGVEVHADSDLPPILVNESRALRALMLFLDRAVAAGAPIPVEVRLTGDADGITLRYACGSDCASDESLTALDRVARLDGGGASCEDGHCSFTLPSLARARAEGY